MSVRQDLFKAENTMSCFLESRNVPGVKTSPFTMRNLERTDWLRPPTALLPQPLLTNTFSAPVHRAEVNWDLRWEGGTVSLP